MATEGFLGIDAGTQGLTVLFTDRDLNVLASGEASYTMQPNSEEGCYEQLAEDWTTALKTACQQMRQSFSGADAEISVLSIGISGQMHGEVMADSLGNPLSPVRLWCDSRNEDEGKELTERFKVKMPKRITAARWLWTIRNHPDKARTVEHLTTPSGWLAFQLTGEWNLGIGDAAGMFPIDQGTLDYDARLLQSFDELVGNSSFRPLKELLPDVRRAGEDAGLLNAHGAELLGFPAGIPVAPAEGDQPASLAGSLIGDAGLVSISFGTSVCANSVGDRSFQGVSKAIDHFCAPDGKPINMVWLRNGTTYMNTIVEMFGSTIEGERSNAFQAVMPMVLQAGHDCGGVMALPFMDDEPGMNISRGGTACLVGLNSHNATPGNITKAALLATMFNLKLGSDILDSQGFPRHEIVLAGGLAKTPQLSQMLADVFDTKVTLLESAEEGTAWGAAVMARFRYQKISGDQSDWTTYLRQLGSNPGTQFSPDSSAVDEYANVFEKYKRLLQTQPMLDKAMNPLHE